MIITKSMGKLTGILVLVTVFSAFQEKAALSTYYQA
jgi:hypothetical protein